MGKLMPHVDFYFDFLSPYSYLATFRISELERKHSARIAWHAIDLDAARAAVGNTRPPAHQIPHKLAWLKADLRRWAERYGAELRFPSDPKFFDSQRTVRLNRAFVWAAQHNSGPQFARATFRALWRDGVSPDEAIATAAKASGLQPDACLAGVDLPEIAATWDRENIEAQERGVFGVPMFVVDDQYFWGNDRIDFLEEYLADPAKAVRF
jgi:2-hydroxychromene-2-carboxylate isomerase